MTDKKIKVGIVGGTGFTAGELIRILLYHPRAEIKYVTSQNMYDRYVSEVHKDLIGETDLKFQKEIEAADLVFICLPHGESKNQLENNFALLKDSKIIDLGNDFRVDNKIGDKTFVYGLCEFFKSDIINASNIANPGCFATAIQLGLLPIVAKESIDEVNIVGITGATGAGKSLQETTNFAWRNNNISAYKTFTHQHIAEIQKSVSCFSEVKTDINFVPWRGDFPRGIFVTLMIKSKLSKEDLNSIYSDAYVNSPFVFVSKTSIDMKQVVNTNKALLFIEKQGEQLAVHVAIDNLLKGASGQAVQNMNLMFGLDEKTGLNLKSVVF